MHILSTVFYITGEFDWGFGSKGDLLGSYYYGYIITQIAGAYLASKIGFKLTWGIASLCSSILTLLIPVVAREGGFGALLVREDDESPQFLRKLKSK
jgi:hypothetical protein